MAIYQNGNKLTNLLNSGLSVNKAYFNGHEIYSKRSKIPENYTYIEFEVNSSSGTFMVPFAHEYGAGRPYHLWISVNGGMEREFNFISSTSSGYELTGLTGNATIIRIRPETLLNRWGACFGFFILIRM